MFLPLANASHIQAAVRCEAQAAGLFQFCCTGGTGLRVRAGQEHFCLCDAACAVLFGAWLGVVSILVFEIIEPVGQIFHFAEQFFVGFYSFFLGLFISGDEIEGVLL